jgi:hypothetical protein
MNEENIKVCQIPEIECTFRKWFQKNRPGKCLPVCPFNMTGEREV